MQTLAQMTNRILRIESQQDTNDANTVLAVHDAINEAYRTLATTYFWGWLSTTADIVTSVDDTHISMPADFIELLQVENADGTILDPRSLARILEFATQINNKGLKTFAQDGTDASGYMKLRLSPASSGETYTITYLAMPAELTADGDVPAGPIGLDDYLVRQARMIRAEDNEDSTSVVSIAERRALESLSRLARTSGQPLRQLTGSVIPLRG